MELAVAGAADVIVTHNNRHLQGGALRFRSLRIDEAKHERLRLVAAQRGVRLNRLMDELATVALAQFDAETSFRVRAGRGSAEEGLRLLDALGAHFLGKPDG